jgi:hypothetical protein
MEWIRNDKASSCMMFVLRNKWAIRFKRKKQEKTKLKRLEYIFL